MKLLTWVVLVVVLIVVAVVVLVLYRRADTFCPMSTFPPKRLEAYPNPSYHCDEVMHNPYCPRESEETDHLRHHHHH